MNQHAKAIWTITLAAVLDLIAGLAYALAEHISIWLGLYWSVLTATTVGYGDIVPHTILGHVIAVLVMLTVIPLFAATFSLFTSKITVHGVKQHVHASKLELKHHLIESLEQYLGGH